ncbi:MAG: TIR domain-containing protein [Bacteroidales bacterium]|nr:TIR domain-containing protein [Bacteroidales bacterium]
MVFISYRSCDRKIAEELVTYLEKRGIPCWISFRDITSGGNFSGEITRALKASDIVLVLCSNESCKSEHVKNEVSLAFNQHKAIIPYLLDPNPFDDDLEYFLSLKQHIRASGNKERDFSLIEKFILDFRGVVSPTPAVPAVPEKKRWPVILAIVLSVLVLGGVAAYFFLPKSPAQEPEAEAPVATETPVVQKTPDPSPQPTVVKEEPQPKVASAPSGGDSFTGSVVNGYPDGFGTYTFKKRRRIDMHDAEERYAEAGDYIKGDWKQGHLNYGEWYSADGTKKAFIRLGDNPDVGSDQSLGKCVKR